MIVKRTLAVVWTAALMALGGCSPRHEASLPDTSDARSTNGITGATLAERTAYRKHAYQYPVGRKQLGRELDPVENRLMAIDDDAQRVTEALRANKLSIAEEIVYGLPESEASDPKWQALKSKVAIAEQKDIDGTISDDFPAKLKETFIPELAKLALDEPATTDEIWARLNAIDVLAENLDQDRQLDVKGLPKADPPKLASARRNFHAAIAAKQVKLFPVLRKAYVRLASEKMWSNNVEIRGSRRNITYSAAMFADNAKVKVGYETSREQLARLRFSHVTFKWCSACSGWSYDLESPSDAAVGTGTGANFHTIK